MNMQQFFEQHRGTHAAKDVEIDPCEGLAALVAEMREATDIISHGVRNIQLARHARRMGDMHEKSRALWDKLKQVNIMAEAMLRITATHRQRGVR